MTTSDFSYRLSGVVRHLGLPVAGVDVWLFDVFDEVGEQAQISVSSTNANIAGQTKTNAKGEFALAVRPGTYRLEAVPNRTTRFLKHVVKELSVLSNTSCIVNLNTGLLLSGRACRNNGVPLRGGTMIGLCIEPSIYLATSPLSIDGNYCLVLPPGKYQIAYLPPRQDDLDEAVAGDGDVDDDHINPDELAPSLAIEQQVVAVESDARSDVTLPPLVAFNGEVVAGAETIEGALVTVVPAKILADNAVSELALVAQCKSDAQGKFKLYLEAGLYDISIEPPGHSPLFALSQSDVQVKENCFQRFVLPSGYRFRGRAFLNDMALSDCLVRVLACEQDREFLAKTDGDGRFELSLPGGDYRVVALAHPKDSAITTIDGIEFMGLAPWSSIVAVRGDTESNFKLEKGTAIYGQVKDDTGNPRAGVKVSVYMDADFDRAGNNKRKSISSTSTDAEGNYKFFLCPGKYWFVVLRDFPNAKQAIVGKEASCLNITWQGWCQLRFEVVGEDGLQIARCKLHSSRYAVAGGEGQTASGNGQSDPGDSVLHTAEDGVCQITLPVGIYTFEFEPPRGSSYSGKVLRQLSVSADLSRKVALPLKASAQLLYAKPAQN